MFVRHAVKNSLTLLMIFSSLAMESMSLANDQETQVSESYANLVYQSYTESHQSVQELETVIGHLLRDPSPATLNAAQNAWIKARKLYGQTEVFRFYEGPIDDAQGPEGQINAWPLDESFIDYVIGNENSGIINNPLEYPQITKELLLSLNEQGGEKNIATGFHAIEFLLWGQDFSSASPGQRPYTDFVISAAPTVERRRQYLALVTAILAEDIGSLVNSWQPDQGENYRHFWRNQRAHENIKRMLTGILYLSGFELSGERMYTALETADQEDEHSCFSDTTNNDLLANALGIANVFLSSFNGKDSGNFSLRDYLVQTGYSNVSTKMSAHINLALASIKAIPAPFDQAISSENSQGRALVLAAVEALEQVAATTIEVGAALGIELELVIEE